MVYAAFSNDNNFSFDEIFRNSDLPTERAGYRVRIIMAATQTYVRSDAILFLLSNPSIELRNKLVELHTA